MRMETLADGVILYCGDCRDILPTLEKVDAVVTDPPYGIGESSKKNASRKKLARPVDYGSFDWDTRPISGDDVRMLREASTWQIIFGGNFFDGLGPTSCWLVWDKLNSGDFADCELAWTNLPKAVRRIQWRWNGMIRQGSDVREHPTQKPLGVMKWCVNLLPSDALTLCDPYMGSGTSGVAAIECGRKFIGIERDPAYFDIACRRVATAIASPMMFVSAPSIVPKQESIF